MNNVATPRHPLAPRIATALLEITAPDPARHTRVVLWTVCALFLALVVWSMVAKVDIVAVAPGRLVPQTYVKVVQPAEGGIIREILVKEGDHVKAGQVLARLDGTLTQADRRTVAHQLAAKRMELRRIDAQLAERPLTRQPGDDAALFAQAQSDAAARRRAFEDQIATEAAVYARTQSDLTSAQETLRKLSVTLPSYQREADAYADLAKRQLVGTLAAEEKKRTALERSQDLKGQEAYVASLQAAANAQQRKLAQVRSTYRSQLQAGRTELVATVAQLEEESKKQGFREELLELKAPQDGVVNELATSSIGGVLQPGRVLMTLVPVSEPLMAEVVIDNRDIGFVETGQSVRLKLSAFDFSKYGVLHGNVHSLSVDVPDTIDEGERASRARGASPNRGADHPFRLIVKLTSQQLVSPSGSFQLTPGMAVQAEIIQGKRSILEYFVSPVVRASSTAATER